MLLVVEVGKATRVDRIAVPVVEVVDGPINRKVVELTEMAEVIREEAEVEATRDIKVATKTTPGAFKVAIREEVEVRCSYVWCHAGCSLG